MSGRLTRLGDLLTDVGVELHTRRARTAMLIAGIALSTGTLISAVSVSTTAAHQVDAGLAASTLDLIEVEASHAQRSDGTASDAVRRVFPEDTERRVRAVPTVVDGGLRLDVTNDAYLRRAGVGASARPPSADEVRVLGLTSGYLVADRVSSPAGWMLDTDAPVALLGTAAANRLGIHPTTDPTGLAVTIEGERYDVVGFLRGGTTPLANAVAIPYDRAISHAGSDAETTILIRTEIGAGSAVARVIRSAIRPDAPQRLVSSQVLDIKDLRTGVSTELDRLGAWVGSLLLVLTVLLIANAMTVSVLGRTAEIGLRRAMGASRAAMASLFLAEGAVTGMLGGLTGSAVAGFATLLVCVINQWTAILSPSLIGLGPIVGMVAGLVCATYPAARASAIHPAVAVRSD